MKATTWGFQARGVPGAYVRCLLLTGSSKGRGLGFPRALACNRDNKDNCSD